ncbi:MAG: hypothetical protein PHH09_06200 [Methanoregulaceae archaeon]|nr:hypothetical protein [Methanoregulaceae archaeon]MDD5048505.1 hypothetical protein [Methanoregulaceae archaeon]
MQYREQRRARCEAWCEEREGAGDAMREKRVSMAARMSTIH